MAPFDLDAIANSRLAIDLAAGLGRATPPSVGRRVARTVADGVAAAKDSSLVRAVQANQWVVSGGTLVGKELDCRVRDVLRHMARCYYDLYRTVEEPEAVASIVQVSGELEEWVERAKRGEAIVFVGAHMSNFDLVGVAFAALGMRAQVLTVPDPTGGYQRQNDMRRQLGLDVTPVSVESLRMAERRLARGGSVVTGVDRPVPGSRFRPRFFGRPAPLPVLHVRLAASAGAPLVFVRIRMGDDGVYRVSAHGPVPLRADRAREAILDDAEVVLAVAEAAIADAPEQWAMPHAVWPETLDLVPASQRRQAGP